MGRYVGQRVRKLDDPALLSGSARFVGDLQLPRMLHAAVLRSPHAHARIVELDTGPARRRAGVAAVLTGAEAQAALHPFPDFFHGFQGLRSAPTGCLATDRVRYVGEPVAVAAAEDRYAAEDALEAIRVAYEPLPPVVNAERALEPDAPRLYEDWPDNLMFHFTVKGGDIEEAFRRADLVVSDRVTIHRYTGTPLETRGYVADFDAASGSLTFWASTQQPHPLRTILATVLQIPESRIRVIQPAVGGAFGLKTPPYPEEPLICLLAMKLGRPVKWIEDRREHFVATGHAREQIHDFEAAVTRDGVVLGLRDRLTVDLGTFFPQQGLMQMYVTAKHLPGPYRIGHFQVEGRGVATNKTSYFAYRGFGKEAANLVYERMMDMVARRLDLDPAEVRFRNFIQPQDFPYPSPSGAVYDSGDYPAALRRALEIIGYRGFRDEQRRARAEGRLLGIGIASAIEPAGASVPASFTQGYDGTTVRVDPSGKVTVLTGITSPGSGNETGIAQVVAEELGVDIEDVTVIQGDTAACPYGLGNYSSRSTIVGASSAILAARDVKEKLLRVAGSMLECDAEDLRVEAGHIAHREAPRRRVPLRDAAMRVLSDPYRLPPGMEPGLEATRYFLTPNIRHTPDAEGHINTYPTYPNAANAAIVEVDPGTGRVRVLRYVVVHDCGTVVNPMLVEGQVRGGIAQGLGGALGEELRYDERGQILTTTFMDYLVPGAADLPDIEMEHQVTPSPFTPLGSKGCGEGGAVAVSATLVSAVEDALAPLGVTLMQTPLRPDAVVQAIAGAAARTP